jgi:hypothetical protein
MNDAAAAAAAAAAAGKTYLEGRKYTIKYVILSSSNIRLKTVTTTCY